MTNDPIIWIDVSPGKVLVGSNNRSILFGGLGPRHEVSIDYNFKISEMPIDYYEAEYLLEKIDVQVASESEWELAFSRDLISAADSSSEVLADNADNYWGKICDGRPHVDPSKKSKIQKNWQNGDIKSTAFFPSKNSKDPIPKIRLVKREKQNWSEKSPRIPSKFENFRMLKEEIVICILFGILPSFTWAFFNASKSYIYDGWLNLLFGGILFGFSTILLWRPRQPTWYLHKEDMIPK